MVKRKKQRNIRSDFTPSQKRVQTPPLTDEGQIELAKLKAEAEKWKTLRIPVTVLSIIILLLVVLALPEDVLMQAERLLKLPSFIIVVVAIVFALITGIFSYYLKKTFSTDDMEV